MATLLLALSPSIEVGSRNDTTRVDPPPITLDTLFATVGSRVSAGVPIATRSVQVITAEELTNSPGSTLAELLGRALGLDIQQRSAAQSDIGLRGSSFEQVLVLVDGVRMSDSQTGHFDLDLALPLSEIERIEIMRGPATTAYGSNAVGGVVQIVTRRGGPAIDASIRTGSFNTLISSLSTALEYDDVRTRIAAEYRRSDGHRPGTDDRGLQTRASIDLRTGERTLRTDIGLAMRDFGARAFYTAPDAPYDEYEETRTTTAALTWLAPETTRFAIEPRLTLRRHDDDFLLYRDDPDSNRNEHTNWQIGGEVIARHQVTPSLGLALGAEAYHEILRSTSLGDREENRMALFAEATGGSIGTASIAVGLRSDWHSSFGTFLAPSLAGALWPRDVLRVHASIGRAFRAPTWTERYYIDPANIGDPDLDPERAWETELGVEFQPSRGVRVGLTGFLRSADGLIDWARPTGASPTDPWRTRNVSDALFHGLEAELALTDPLGTEWKTNLTILSLDTEETGGLTSKYALRPLTRTASVIAERNLLDRLSLMVRGSYSRRLGEDDYLLGDLRMRYEWGASSIYLDLLNLAGVKYVDLTGMTAPGRALYLGVSWGMADS